jgi:hypothetical protein
MTVENEVTDSSLIARPHFMGKERAEMLQGIEDEANPQPTDVNGIPADEDADPATLNAEEITFRKRYGDHRRHHEKVVQEKDELIARLQKEATERTAFTPPKSEEDLAIFAEQNPDMYDTLVSVAHSRMSEGLEEVAELKAELEAERKKTAHADAKAVILAKHPDWNEIRVDDAFHDWAESKPKRLQDDLYDSQDDGELVSSLVDMYKLEMGQATGKPTPKKRSVKESAAELVNLPGGSSIEGNEKPSFSRRQIDLMSEKQYSDNEKQILEAQREGRIINDK